ncbi:CynX/NimT family MFS transporter [Psychromarinibacter halotolerans]|uniref:CynX/NimT family MFS transporter n=1 Tax=Psychromarinibacter halotolerans TaxID=1775175 RepID=A0ABV7GSF9_9RHOB|nr:MFS transporter [Psychromarinibacter halotolerans]MDF0598931.1 MFS transporter [Psychromarinibacter halotolerans]
MSTASLLDTKYSWTRLAITLAVASIGNVGMWAVIMVLPSVEVQFDVSRADASLPWTLTMVGYALGNLLLGRAIDRFGVTRVLLVAAVSNAAGFALASASTGILMLSLCQLLIGFGTAASFGPLIADISQWFLRRRGVAVGIAAAGNYLSGAVWPWLLSDVLVDRGWSAVYLTLSVATLALMIPGALALRRRVPPEAQAESDAVSSLNRGRVNLSPAVLQWALVVAGVGCCVAMSMPQVHIVALCTDLGYGPAVGTEMLSLMLWGGVLSRFVSGVMADRLGGVMTLMVGSTLQCIALLLYLPAGGMASLYAVSLVFGLSQGGIVPSYAVIIREYMPAREAGARVGFVICATILGMALGGWLSGWIYDQTGSYTMAFLNGIAWNLLNLAIVGYIFFTTRRRAGLAHA